MERLDAAARLASLEVQRCRTRVASLSATMEGAERLAAGRRAEVQHFVSLLKDMMSAKHAPKVPATVQRFIAEQTLASGRIAERACAEAEQQLSVIRNDRTTAVQLAVTGHEREQLIACMIDQQRLVRRERAAEREEEAIQEVAVARDITISERWGNSLEATVTTGAPVVSDGRPISVASHHSGSAHMPPDSRGSTAGEASVAASPRGSEGRCGLYDLRYSASTEGHTLQVKVADRKGESAAIEVLRSASGEIAVQVQTLGGSQGIVSTMQRDVRRALRDAGLRTREQGEQQWRGAR